MIKDCVKIEQHQYKFIKIIPCNGVLNNNTDKIAKAINSLYIDLSNIIQVEEYQEMRILGKERLVPKLMVTPQAKITYFNYITKDKAEFYFIIPEKYLTIIEEKINNTWSGITIQQVDSIPTFSKDAAKYAMEYTKEDGLSLLADKRDNFLISSNLNIIDILKENDKIGIVYNFIPTGQQGWRAEYRETIDKYKKGKRVDKNKRGAGYIAVTTVNFLLDIVNTACEVLTFGKSKEKTEDKIELFFNQLNKKPSTETEYKGLNQVIKTQIAIISESDKHVRAVNNANSIANSFDVIAGDNSLRKKRIKEVNLMKVNIHASTMKCSLKECSNFISLPGRAELEKHTGIEKIKAMETEIPNILQKGTIRLGTNKYRGAETEAYASNDPELKHTAMLLVGPNRCGKTTAMQNIVKDCLDAGECVIELNFIKNNEGSHEILEVVEENKKLIINCNDRKNIQAMAYEMQPSSDPFERYDIAKKQTVQLIQLINMVNDQGQPLTSKMERYLKSASIIAFANNQPFGSVFSVLQNHEFRHSQINRINDNMKEYLDEHIETLKELDQLDKETLKPCGTKSDRIEGIIDRLEKLKMNTSLELMLKADVKNNINLVEEINKNQYIAIHMPQSMFNTNMEKDIYCTYWLTKIWFALIARADKFKDQSKELKINFIIDEIYQVRNCERFLSSIINQTAKFHFKPIISCHYLSQIPTLKQELTGTAASYMFIKGCSEKVYNEMKTELLPYTFEDMQEMGRYHALNLVNTGEQYYKFITKLPAPIK